MLTFVIFWSLGCATFCGEAAGDRKPHARPVSGRLHSALYLHPLSGAAEEAGSHGSGAHAFQPVLTAPYQLYGGTAGQPHIQSDGAGAGVHRGRPRRPQYPT